MKNKSDKKQSELVGEEEQEKEVKEVEKKICAHFLTIKCRGPGCGQINKNLILLLSRRQQNSLHSC